MGLSMGEDTGWGEPSSSANYDARALRIRSRTRNCGSANQRAPKFGGSMEQARFRRLSGAYPATPGRRALLDKRGPVLHVGGMCFNNNYQWDIYVKYRTNVPPLERFPLL